ncbi:MAG TPA: penicillin-binding protein 2 [Longimicrobiaceae bacterium]
MRLFQPDSRQRRTLGALFAISFVIAVLLTAFYNTQIVRGESYALASEDNRLRPVVIPAPRGTIYDRYGEVVATSIPGFSVVLLPGTEETIRATLEDLQRFLGLADSDVERLMRQRETSPHGLLTITEDATFSQVAALEERRASFPNLLIVDRPKRYYPAGPAIGHIIGYVSEISDEELQLPIYQEAGYRQGRWIGKAGVEKQYELRLSGEDGARFVEVDAKGRIVNPRSTVEVQPPVPGQDLRLTLDLELQKYIAEIFPDTMKGAVVAMVPSTGEILAMYSNPSYDPNDFVGGISGRLWSALQNDPLKPLIDRTIGARYPPASTFKLATAAMGVKLGLVNASTRMPIPCTGGLSYAGRYWRCWQSQGHGALDLASAIEKSCNVYFYQLGLQIGLQKFIEEGTRIGFDERTGIDLPNEARPIFPLSLEWYEDRYGYRPKSSEVLSLSIGQGPNTQTVLRMAHFYSAIAGNGTAPAPHLVQGEAPAEGGIDLGLTPEQLETLWAGLVKVVQPGGTAVLSSLANWQIYGKTGTAQNPPNPDHGWFIGFSGKPGGTPEIVVAAIIEHGLHGSDVAPLAAKVINHYLSRKHGIPVDPQPTYIERLESGRARGPDTYPAPLHPGLPPGAGTLATAPEQAQSPAEE